MPSAKRVDYWMLVHPEAPDLAWGARGWTAFAAATVFSNVGRDMFKARRKVRGRWMRYPDVLTMPPAPRWIDVNRAVPALDSEHNVDNPTNRAVTRKRNRLEREARARALREADPLPLGVKR